MSHPPHKRFIPAPLKKTKKTCSFTHWLINFYFTTWEHLSWRHAPLPRLPPPLRPKRTGEVCRCPSASAAGCWASLCPHARSEAADWEQNQLWDLSPFRVNTWITTNSFYLYFPLYLYLFLLFFCSRKTKPANMSRTPDGVSKLTESTYKVSEQIRK